MPIYTFAPMPTFGVSEHPFVTWENAFTDEEMDRIVALGDALTLTQAVVGAANGGEYIKDVRESKVAWLSFNQDAGWIFDRMAWIARQLNGQFYKFELAGFCEDIQFTTYDGESEGHYTWHTDAGASNGAPPRKFSMVLQLSAPEQYEGGELQVFTSSEPTTVTKKRGLIAGFPSYTLHRVTPVTSGVRKTLVVWACGPAFK